MCERPSTVVGWRLGEQGRHQKRSLFFSQDWRHVLQGGGWRGGVNKKRVGDIGAVGPRRDAITTMGVGETHFHSLSMSYSHALGAILHRFYFTFSFS